MKSYKFYKGINNSLQWTFILVTFDNKEMHGRGLEAFLQKIDDQSQITALKNHPL